MTGLDRIREHMARVLEEAGVRVMTAWPAEGRKRLRAPVAVVSVRGCESGPGGFQDYLGERYDRETGTWQELYGRRVSITFGLDLYAPGAEGAGGCQAAFDALASALSNCGRAGLRVKALSRGEVGFDQESGLFRCPVTAVCEAYLYAVTDGAGAFLEFEVKGERT